VVGYLPVCGAGRGGTVNWGEEVPSVGSLLGGVVEGTCGGVSPALGWDCMEVIVPCSSEPPQV